MYHFQPCAVALLAQFLVCTHMHSFVLLYLRKDTLQSQSFVMAHHLAGIVANKAFAKGKLILYPVGQVNLAKDPKPSMVLMEHTSGQQLQIMPPKLDLAKEEGCFVPYFHVKASASPKDVNMECFTTKVKGFQVPGYRNTTKIDTGMQLFYLKGSAKEAEEEEEPQAAKTPTKKRKT